MRSHGSLKLKTVFAAAGILAATLVSGTAAAQGTALTVNDLGLSEAQSKALFESLNVPASAPGISFGSPAAFGAGWGELGVAVGGQTIPKVAHAGGDAVSGEPHQGGVDGSMAFTGGLGDPQKYVGLEATVNIISLRKSFGDDGDFSLKLHTLLPYRSAFAVGVNGVGRWGAAKGGKSSVYAVGTKYFDLNPTSTTNTLPLSVNLGIGDSEFNSVDFNPTGGTHHDVNCDCTVDNGFDKTKSGATLFGGVSLVVIRQVSLIADWTGRSLNMGVSVAPFRSIPLVGIIGALNVTGEYQGRQFGDSTEFGAGVGYNFDFK
jgi:hypothetical protein